MKKGKNGKKRQKESKSFHCWACLVNMKRGQFTALPINIASQGSCQVSDAAVSRTIADQHYRIDESGLLLWGDNFQGMSGLLDGYKNQIDLIYIDPPFNSNADYYHSPERTAHVSSARSASLAYSDKFAFDEYLEFIRERVILMHLLLSESGSLYFHIDVKIGHYIKIILDEVFGRGNFLNEITRIKSNPKNFARKAYGNEKDVIYFYAKKAGQNIFNNIKEKYSPEILAKKFPKTDPYGRRYTTVPCHAPGETKNGPTGMKWKNMCPPPGRHWRWPPEELERLDAAGFVEWSKNSVPRIIKYADEHEGCKIQDVWTNFKDPQYPLYPTEKNMEMLELIVRQSSNPNSLVMDCFCGSGAFLAAAMRHGRRVIGMDQSGIAIKVASQRPELAKIPTFKI